MLKGRAFLCRPVQATAQMRVTVRTITMMSAMKKRDARNLNEHSEGYCGP